LKNLVGSPIQPSELRSYSTANGFSRLRGKRVKPFIKRAASWRHIYGAAWLGGIGFTLSLFVTSLAFTDAASIEAAKIGILTASALSAVGAAVVLMGKRGD
jgi:NhaA family Na+:H+ antiporter